MRFASVFSRSVVQPPHAAFLRAHAFDFDGSGLPGFLFMDRGVLASSPGILRPTSDPAHGLFAPERLMVLWFMFGL